MTESFILLICYRNVVFIWYLYMTHTFSLTNNITFASLAKTDRQKPPYRPASLICSQHWDQQIGAGFLTITEINTFASTLGNYLARASAH